ncbi:glutamate-cysteine ligase family protein [Actinocorallia sp. API 0066]|uniref:carboxylate-amine ligase n=1 Tax=Actinocorallia sp. API 0066 TaxID=2896846 RepID=UPI001E5CA240|nr:glutamate-cysteine ligase family protein [Actinocorallia sp. API 0066]MCD0448002.1 glutamate-cysteine ligase family protein [Actinocorallia sp. API 0066]
MSVIEAGPAVAVEEEFLLVDAASGGAAAQVPHALADAGGTVRRGRVVATASAPGLGALRRSLAESRRRLAAAAEREGLRLVAAGTPVLPCLDPPRPARSAGPYAALAADHHVCGCRVRVNVPDRDTAVAVVNHLVPWLPSLLSLSVNSPYDRGSDTGYGSWRTVLLSRFPGGGLPPHLGSATEHDRKVDRLVDCGVLTDPTQTFWAARPSPDGPGVEVRVADTAGTLDEAVFQAALTRALVRVALGLLAGGREAGPVDPQLGSAALWTAARYGMSGFALDLRRGRRIRAAEAVSTLLGAVRPALADTGDLPEARRLWRFLRDHGTGADRQRRASGDGPHAVLTMLAAQTVPAGTVPAQAPRG